MAPEEEVYAEDEKYLSAETLARLRHIQFDDEEEEYEDDVDETYVDEQEETYEDFDDESDAIYEDVDDEDAEEEVVLEDTEE